jgi:hypothetical protein
MRPQGYTYNPDLDEYDEQELDDAFDILLDGTTDADARTEGHAT